MELARGSVSDRPWGQTLGVLAVRRASGQLTLQADDGKQYCIALDDGMVVGATSPPSADSAVRIALANHMISAAHAHAISRVAAAQPELDELDVLLAVCQLDLEPAIKLRQKILTQRAGRTFGVAAGTFTLDDTRTIRSSATGAVDLRAVVYVGARLQLDALRMAEELKRMGSLFTLPAHADHELAAYGLVGHERPILDELRKGATLADLEAKHRNIDPRDVQALIYALLSCSTIESCFAVDVDVDAVTYETTRVKATLSPPIRGATYVQLAARSNDPARAAAEAFERGLDALRIDAVPLAIEELEQATQIDPQEFDYHAMLAWAQFCLTPDRQRVADKTRKMLGHAVQTSRRPELPRLCLGRMERMLGHDREALVHFQQIVDDNPTHAEALAELRTLKTSLAAGSAEKPGLASLFGRKKSPSDL